MERKRLLIYGGAFDPPHKGHELLLKSAVRELKPDKTLIVPTAVSPHKATPGVSFSDRAKMCRAFLSCADGVRISGVELIDRRERSYTTKTLARLRGPYGEYDFYYLIGGDMLLSFKQWRRWTRILSQCTLVAAARENNKSEVEAAARELRRSGGDIIVLDLEPVDISSTEIRDMISRGEDAGEYLSEFVTDYIERRNLYK